MIIVCVPQHESYSLESGNFWWCRVYCEIPVIIVVTSEVKERGKMQNRQLPTKPPSQTA
jgi:hypothetical protein